MHPEQIKAAIRMKGTTPSAIADELCVNRTTVGQVIHGKSVSSRISEHISALLGVPVAKLWPNKQPTLTRRRQAAKKTSKGTA